MSKMEFTVSGKSAVFCLTVEAACEIAELTPDKRINGIASLYGSEKTTREEQDATMQIAVILSKGGRDREAFEHPDGALPDVLSMEDFRGMPMKAFLRMDALVAKALSEGMAPEVEVEEEEGKNA